jgi:hypothetical protein
MRYLFIVKAAQGPAPTPELMQAMHELAQREISAGRMLDDGGLAPPSAGCQVTVQRGVLRVTDGPFTEAKELIGGYAVFDLPGHAEALESAREFMQLHKDFMPDWEGTCEVRAIAGSLTHGG